MILKLHALLLLDLLMKVEKVGCSACLKLSSLWAEGNSRSKSDLCQHKPWKVKSLYEMDVFTPTLCSLERDSSMMNNVMGNKSVFGHCVFNIKNTSQRSAFFFFFSLGLSHFMLQRSSVYVLLSWILQFWSFCHCGIEAENRISVFIFTWQFHTQDWALTQIQYKCVIAI